MSTKVIVHACKRSPEVADLKHNYRGHARRSKSERSYQGSRVYKVVGNTCGLGVIPKKPGAEKSLVDILAGPNRNRVGKRLRQLHISSEDLPPDKKDDFYTQVLEKLLKAAAKWVEKYAPGCRWAAWAHMDRNHPHVHLVVENWDYARDRRLDLSPDVLHRMQGMDWCADLGIVSGRGSRKQIEAGLALLGQSKKFEDCTHQERIQIKAAVRDNGRLAVAAKFEKWLKKQGIAPVIDSMQSAFEHLTMPDGWSTKTRTKAGGLLRKPSITIEGVTLRLDKFIELRDRLPKPNLNPDIEI